MANSVRTDASNIKDQLRKRISNVNQNRWSRYFKALKAFLRGQKSKSELDSVVWSVMDQETGEEKTLFLFCFILKGKKGGRKDSWGKKEKI